jgi:hypothetical protein
MILANSALIAVWIARPASAQFSTRPIDKSRLFTFSAPVSLPTVILLSIGVEQGPRRGFMLLTAKRPLMLPIVYRLVVVDGSQSAEQECGHGF